MFSSGFSTNGRGRGEGRGHGGGRDRGRGRGQGYGKRESRHENQGSQNEQGYRGRGDRKCHNCQDLSHVAKDCSKPKSQESYKQTNERPVELTFGFKRLFGFLTDDAEKVIMSITRNISEWSQLIDSLPRTDEFFALILHLLGQKVCQMDDVLVLNRVEIVNTTLRDNFMKQVQSMYGNMFMAETGNRFGQKSTIDVSRAAKLRSLHTIFAFVTYRCPNLASDYVQPLLPGAIGVLSAMAILDNAKPAIDSAGVTKLQEDFKQLMETISAFKLKVKAEELCKTRFNKFDLTEAEEAALHDVAPPEDFREIPITPTIEELMSTDEPFLRPNKKEGSYASGDHYLDVQFRLLREDFVQPLKRGIQDFRKYRTDYLSKKRKMPIGNVRVYPHVTIQTVALVRDTMVYSVQLPQDQGQRRINWERSKRLLTGSLLVFTHDEFRSAYFATVASRDLQQLNKGLLGVAWEGDVPPFKETFLMVECEVYFEAYRHNLNILKKLELDTFPLAKFIVEGSDTVGAPEYMQEMTELMRIGYRNISPLELPWPEACGLSFDDNQFDAFQAAITKEFSIIQGPPGTGKTYLGLKIAETFLQNWDVWREEDEEGPILVVCYTNHALDQFLEGIVDIMKKLEPKKEPALIRVGGRSKCEALDLFSLAKRRVTADRLRTFTRDYAQSKYEAGRAVQDLQSMRATLLTEVVGLGNVEGIVNFEHLQCYSALKKDVSSAILSQLSDPKWYGLTDQRFSASNFSAPGMISTWFRLGHTPITTQVVPRAAPSVALPNEGEDDDEEDYDLDELMANRVTDWDDEIMFEVSKRPGNKSESMPYLFQWSIPDCQGIIKTGQRKLDELRTLTKPPTGQSWADVQKEGSTIANQLQFAQNRNDFLELLLSLHKEGQLDLPDMKPYVANTLAMMDVAELPKLSPAQKWSLYFTIVEIARGVAVEATTKINIALVAAQKRLEEIKRYGDGLLLRQTKVVGMTTTGAAKYNDFLQMMKSKIVIVEEAAEVLESHIVTCITKHCQQLILIGDHQQLRPSTTVYDLSVKYHMDISLFERMLNNNLNCYRLKVQHRMRPEIADLVVGTIYTTLENAPNVFDYPDVEGMHRNLFFLDHQKYEKSEADSMSKSNTFEASFLAHLCRHLVLQGYDPSDITVLTTYTGQMFLLKKEIGNFNSCKGVRITVVDNYQGEENKIILLSLVRSNEDNNIGFLKTDNRICVAISRAKHGLYICGNMTNLTAKSKTWTHIQEKLNRRQEIGPVLKLVCRVHETITEVAEANDFISKASNGGCHLLCGIELNCGHVCDRACHSIDREHENDYKCIKNCLSFCKNDHPCRARCSTIPCPRCDTKMEKTLPCKHVLKMPCHLDPMTVNCRELIEKTKPCGHKDMLACFVDPAKVKCHERVDRTLPCKHEKNVECNVDVESIQCRVTVPKILVPCGHEQVVECRMHPEMVSCETDVEKEFPACKHKAMVKCKNKDSSSTYCVAQCQTRLKCGHQCPKTCHVLADPMHMLTITLCKKECARECENGHRCARKHLCHQKCQPCTKPVEKILSCGTHMKMLPCNVDVGSVECTEPCTLTVPTCNHRCIKKCYEQCTPCQKMVSKLASCGHYRSTKCSESPTSVGCKELVKSNQVSLCKHDTLVPCDLKATITPEQMLTVCQHPCEYTFQPAIGDKKGCDHKCQGTCSGCQQGRLHIKCQEECGRPLLCGHVCDAPCASACPPCQKPCLMKCEHSECKAKCGTPCTNCKEKCTWRCPHKQCSKLCSDICDREPCDEPCQKMLKCDHPCVGFCGEPCPPICRICDKEKLTEFQLLGTEEEDDARFVYLEDCGHAIEVEGLTYHMNLELENGEIGIKKCPRCNTLIRQSKRFGNILRAKLKDIVVIKKKIFGDQKIAKLKQKQLVFEIQNQRETIMIMNDFSPGINSFFRDKMLIELRMSRGGEKSRHRTVPLAEIYGLEVIWNHVKDVARILTESKAFIQEADIVSMKQKYGLLFQRLRSTTLPLTKTEMENFEAEFDRHYYICELYKRKRQALSSRGNVNGLYTEVYNLVNCTRPYTLQDKDQVHQLLKDLDHSLKSGLQISERVRMEILGALGSMREGRWFKCPNGHYYVIGDCGGAMVEAKCPECKATIGGADHRVRSDNQFAPEMDGAVQPLWPQ